MNPTELLPAALVAGFAIGTKFAVDLAARVCAEAFGRELPSWAKRAISLAVATAMTLQAQVDFFEALTGRATVAGYVLTALILAGVASEVAHPAIEAAKAARRRLEDSDGV